MKSNNNWKWASLSDRCPKDDKIRKDTFDSITKMYNKSESWEHDQMKRLLSIGSLRSLNLLRKFINDVIKKETKLQWDSLTYIIV